MSYLSAHWYGKLPLFLSLWVNMLALLVALSYLEPVWLLKLKPESPYLLQYTLASLILTKLVIFPWQIIGLFRSIEFDYLEHKNFLKTRTLQLACLFVVLYTMFYSLGIIQNSLGIKNQLKHNTQQADEPNYQASINHLQQLEITGILEIGITLKIQSLLDKHPEITSVRLSSEGGQIYEGRGLSKLFTLHGLSTYVYGECSSACITAYIGGHPRYLGPKGKLGFHQYTLDTSQTRLRLPFFDLASEQAKDQQLLQSRGVDLKFLSLMFNRPSQSIWFPSQAELLEANLVTQLLHD